MTRVCGLQESVSVNLEISRLSLLDGGVILVSGRNLTTEAIIDAGELFGELAKLCLHICLLLLLEVNLSGDRLTLILQLLDTCDRCRGLGRAIEGRVICCREREMAGPQLGTISVEEEEGSHLLSSELYPSSVAVASPILTAQWKQGEQGGFAHRRSLESRNRVRW